MTRKGSLGRILSFFRTPENHTKPTKTALRRVLEVLLGVLEVVLEVLEVVLEVLGVVLMFCCSLAGPSALGR